MLPSTAPKSRVVLSFVFAALVAGIAWNYSSDKFATSAAGKSAPPVKRGPATIVLQNGYDLPAVYDETRPDGFERATTLASADFDVDGHPDLVSGYATGDGGYVVIQRGNPEAFAPTLPENVQAIGAARFPVAFLPQTNLIELADSPDFIVVGDFDRDSDPDVITASRGGTELNLIAGDGDGEFALAGRIALPGRVTTIASGQIDLTDGKDDLVVGIDSDNGAALLVYNSDLGIVDAPVSYALPAAAQSVVLAELDETFWRDAAILAGGEVFILHGRNQSAGFESAKRAGQRLERIYLPFAARALAVGQFVWDRSLRNELAILRDDGSVALVARGEQDERPFTVGEMRERRLQQRRIMNGDAPAAPLTNWKPNPIEKWTVADSLSVMEADAVPNALTGNSPVIFRALLSDQNTDDLVVVDAASQQLKIFAVEAPPKLANGEYTSFAGPRAVMLLPTGGSPVAALSMRTGLFARPGLVFLKDGSNAPEIIPAAPTATFTVTKTADTNDGACNADCSLREAHAASNGGAGADIITLGAGTYTLTIANGGGSNEDNGSNGDLDVNDGTTLNGAAAATTIIQAGTTNANGIDKVAGYNPICTGNLSHSINNVTYRFGRNTQPFGAADFSYTGGGMDICNFGSGTVSVTNSVISDSTNTDGPGGGLNIATAPGDTSTVNVTGTTLNANRLTRALGGTQGGGISLGNGATNINITNCQITNNVTQNGNNVGGGLYSFNITTSQTMVHGTTISGNTANGQGGGAYITGQQTVSNVIDQASVVTGNSSTSPTVGTASEGGGVYASVVLTNTLTFTEVTFTSNAATSGLDLRGGGGIGFGQGNATVSFCRFFGNTATSGTGLRKDNNPGTVTATNNWWGCSGGPGTTGCQTAVLQGAPAVLTTSPFLQLRTSASPTTVLVGQGSALTASFLVNSAGGAVAASNLDTLIGQTVNWSGVNGSISGAQTTIQAAGTAAATYTGTSAGAGSGTAQVDGGPASGSTNTAAITVTNTATWDGSTSSDWHTATNWTTDFAPVAGNVVNLPSGALPNEPAVTSADATVSSLTINTGRSIQINNSRTLTITSSMAMNGGNVDSINSGTLLIDNGATLTRTTGNVNTTVALRKNFSGGAIAEQGQLAPQAIFTFPVGTSTGYSPVTANVTAGSNGSLTVQAVNGTAPSTPALSDATTLDRYWQMSETGDITASLTFSYLQADVDGTETNYRLIRTAAASPPIRFPNGCPSSPCVDAAANTIFANPVSSFDNFWTAGEPLAPTASTVTVAGRVFAEGQGLRNAVVTITDSTGAVRSTRTSSFGYYSFSDVAAGRDYVVSVTSKGFTFQPRAVSVNDSIADLDFTASP